MFKELIAARQAIINNYISFGVLNRSDVIGKIKDLRETGYCDRCGVRNEMKVEIIEGEACPDHIHLLVSIPPYMSVAQFAGTLKSESALMIFDRHTNLKYK